MTNPATVFSRLGCADDAIANFPPTLDAGPRRSLRRGPAQQQHSRRRPPGPGTGGYMCLCTWRGGEQTVAGTSRAARRNRRRAHSRSAQSGTTYRDRAAQPTAERAWRLLNAYKTALPYSRIKGKNIRKKGKLPTSPHLSLCIPTPSPFCLIRREKEKIKGKNESFWGFRGDFIGISQDNQGGNPCLFLGLASAGRR